MAVGDPMTNAPINLADQILTVSSWQPDDEFPIFPVGSKPKRAIYSPEGGAFPFVVPKHRYLFKISTGRRIFQHWSEVVAYKVAVLLGLSAAPCHIAVDDKEGTVGVAVEFFYGHPGTVAPRFVAGSDIMKRAIRGYDEKTGRQHNVITNIRAADVYKVPDAARFWGATFAFDALIGNTDRHPENWGFLAAFDSRGQRPSLSFAPLFDHGTSFGYELDETRLGVLSRPDRLKSYILRGRHHVRWNMQDQKPALHADLCRRLVEEFPVARVEVARIAEFPLHEISNALSMCTKLRLPEGELSQERAEMMYNLLVLRQQNLLRALG